MNERKATSAALRSDVDRFVCRREGHKPTVTFTRLRVTGTAEKRLPFFTTCRVCGKWFEMEVDPNG